MEQLHAKFVRQMGGIWARWHCSEGLQLQLKPQSHNDPMAIRTRTQIHQAKVIEVCPRLVGETMRTQ